MADATVELDLPLRVISSLNQREHWAAKARRAKQERVTTAWMLAAEPKPSLPCVVLLTRIAPRKLDDDNLRGAFKAVRDEVARWLGVDDADPRVRWAYAQTRGRPKQFAARVTIQGDAVTRTDRPTPTLAAWLKALIAERATSQRAAANAMGVHWRTLSDWCTDTSYPSTSGIRALAKWSGLSASEIMEMHSGGSDV